jgi:hypothetical protein
MTPAVALLLFATTPVAALSTSLEPEKKPRRELEILPGATAAEVEEAPPHKYVTIAWLPLQALVPLAAFAVEVRLADRFSISVSGGYGSSSVFVAADRKERRAAVQLGGLFSYYVAGDFDSGGVHVGAAAQWTRIGGSEQLATSAVRPGLLLGPLLGFKWVIKSGFTLDSQIGIGFVVAETSGSKAYDPDQKTALLGNLAVGFTF